MRFAEKKHSYYDLDNTYVYTYMHTVHKHCEYVLYILQNRVKETNSISAIQYIHHKKIMKWNSISTLYPYMCMYGYMATIK